ncbi:MAG: Glycosyltransferase AglE [Candidatus Bathyarchaeota archaeon BA1]|nr:MAG: Glycosyltransferase AglE [Candidatus Bathyarchaeota archaeon BA1]
MDGHKVSVVILTRNSVATIRKSLESIFQQTRKPDEVIVVDGGSTDGTLDVIERYPIKLVTEPGLGFGHARNLGVRNAEGDLIYFIDSDCYADPQWIKKMLPHFDDPEIAGVTGQTRLWNVNSGVARFLACVGGRMSMPTQHNYVKIAPTMNLAIRRNEVLDIGGFDEELVRCEDTDLTYKVTQRHKILYEPEAIIWFRGSPTLRVATNKCIHHFVGVGQLFAKHGFNPLFVRLNLLIRGFILIIATVSLFWLSSSWYLPSVLFAWLLIEFVYKTSKMYWRYRDSCVTYYIVFFTFWSLASLAIFYGLYLGLRGQRKSVGIKVFSS